MESSAIYLFVTGCIKTSNDRGGRGIDRGTRDRTRELWKGEGESGQPAVAGCPHLRAWASTLSTDLEECAAGSQHRSQRGEGHHDLRLFHRIQPPRDSTLPSAKTGYIRFAQLMREVRESGPPRAPPEKEGRTAAG